MRSWFIKPVEGGTMRKKTSIDHIFSLPVERRKLTKEEKAERRKKQRAEDLETRKQAALNPPELRAGLCDVWWHEKDEAGNSVKVCCTNRATKHLYDEQSYVGSTCDKEEVKVGDDWMGFTISRSEQI
jgi:hypothetical protein